jgi:hypothetical protein
MQLKQLLRSDFKFGFHIAKCPPPVPPPQSFHASSKDQFLELFEEKY